MLKCWRWYQTIWREYDKYEHGLNKDLVSKLRQVGGLASSHASRHRQKGYSANCYPSTVTPKLHFEKNWSVSTVFYLRA